LDFSHETRGIAQDKSALLQSDRFDDSFRDNVDTGSEFPSKSDSSRNPFIVANNESPKKSSNLFQKSSEMMMATKSNKYDVFKNEIVSGREEPVVQQASLKAKTEVNPDLFKDFALAAFGEFKVDKTSTMIHEFSNKLSDQKRHFGHQMMKVIHRQVLRTSFVHVWKFN
jgi:hypothetical protein